MKDKRKVTAYYRTITWAMADKERRMVNRWIKHFLPWSRRGRTCYRAQVKLIYNGIVTFSTRNYTRVKWQ